nr:MAG TPA: hypothetical protein [Caudoviricetes sp.]
MLYDGIRSKILRCYSKTMGEFNKQEGNPREKVGG